MTNLVADEHYAQDMSVAQRFAGSGLDPRSQPRESDVRVKHRELRSDFLVVRLGPADVPVPFRDVYEVDGKPVRDRADRLSELFLHPTDDTLAQAWRVAGESARYNIGIETRTVNVPVLPVVVLRAQNQPRFRFTDRGETTEDRVRVRQIDFEEVRHPTIIRGTGDSDLPASGRLWIVPATGRVVKGDINTADPTMRVTISVRYAFDRAANAVVPVEMREAYRLLSGMHVTGTATYSSFRRFGVEVFDRVDTDRLRPVIDVPTGIELMQIPAGRFAAGSPDAEWGRNADEIRHEVTLSRPFLLGRTEVTQDQWQHVIGTNPTHFSSCGPQCPVENVTYVDVQEFLTRLNGRSSEFTYRLPTEAEWEYPCRAGTATPFSTGGNLTADEANVNGAQPYGTFAPGVFRRTTTPAGSFPPNAWGLADMHGNLWEWTSDWYGPYPAAAATDPRGPSNGERRVIRGGSWFFDTNSARCALRYTHLPGDRGFSLGFRVAAERR